MDAKLLQALQVKYTVSGSVYSPDTPSKAFTLHLRPSKYFGRPDYIQAYVKGTAKPLFISSVYEPRTTVGLFNIEVAGKRLEALPTPDGRVELVTLQELRKRSGVTFTRKSL
jgi:hypothetical protein